MFSNLFHAINVNVVPRYVNRRDDHLAKSDIDSGLQT